MGENSKNLPPTDSRLRPDIRKLEEGEVGKLTPSELLIILNNILELTNFEKELISLIIYKNLNDFFTLTILTDRWSWRGKT